MSSLVTATITLTFLSVVAVTTTLALTVAQTKVKETHFVLHKDSARIACLSNPKQRTKETKQAKHKTNNNQTLPKPQTIISYSFYLFSFSLLFSFPFCNWYSICFNNKKHNKFWTIEYMCSICLLNCNKFIVWNVNSIVGIL